MNVKRINALRSRLRYHDPRHERRFMAKKPLAMTVPCDLLDELLAELDSAQHDLAARVRQLEEALKRMCDPAFSDDAMFGSWEEIGRACIKIARDALDAPA